MVARRKTYLRATFYKCYLSAIQLRTCFISLKYLRNSWISEVHFVGFRVTTQQVAKRNHWFPVKSSLFLRNLKHSNFKLGVASFWCNQQEITVNQLTLASAH